MVEIDENRLMQLVGKILLELLEDKRLSRDELIALAKELAKGDTYIGDAMPFKVIKKR